MFFKTLGIRSKIVGGFLLMILIGLIIGLTGYISLNKVVKDAELEELALSVNETLLEARRQEKNYIIRNNEASYDELVTVLDELKQLSDQLKSENGDDGNLSEIETRYKQAAAEMKRITEENARLLQTLQAAGTQVETIADQEVKKVTDTVREKVLETSSESLNENALKSVRDIVKLGYDVLQFHYSTNLGIESALNALRNMHFGDSNYYYVVQEDLKLVSHGSRRELEGQDFGVIQDKKTGKTFMREVVQNAIKDGESETRYFWTKPGMGDAVFPKVTIARHFKPWGLVVCAGVYVDNIEQKAREMQQMLDDGFDQLQQAGNIKTLALNARVNALYYFKFKENDGEVAENLSKLKGLEIASAELKSIAEQYNQTFQNWVANDQKIEEQIRAITSLARKGMDTSKDLAETAKKGFAQSAASGKMTIMIFLLVGIGVGLAVAVWLALNITRPIQQAISGLKNASDEVASASGQVASASQELAEGASEQAASLEETSSSLEQMSSMTKTNDENAGQADHLVKEGRQDMNKAEQAMNELTTSMNDISTASEETQKIVKTIDEIAFQTNLLALNAAVEAARAGEAGAGFAVVAEEVRNLAIRSAEAAKNTAELIEGTVKKVKDGSNSVGNAGEAFAQVITRNARVGELISEIAAASHEQADGIEQVNKAVAEMDKVTQQTAANAEESASASEEMSAQAEEMGHIINQLALLVEGMKKGQSFQENRPSIPTRQQKSSKYYQPSKARLTQHHSKNKAKAESIIPMDDNDYEDF
jgi:methyl-accepting chemotaxis protein